VNIKRGKIARGFTLIELGIVLLIVGLLASLAAPMVINSVLRAKESVLKQNLAVTREAIDDYFADHGYYPENIEKLVEDKYLRTLPYDPIAESDVEWSEQESESADLPGVIDIQSASTEEALDGTYYSEW